LSTNCTFETIASVLRSTVSERRYLHSIGVAQTTEMLLEHYGCTNYEKTWNGFTAGAFCGMVHDLARENTDENLLKYCREHNVKLTDEEQASPVLSHGKVSADMARKLCPDYPASWQRAVELHTTGGADMDDLALALFAADFIEPTRKFLTDAQRNAYLEHPSLDACTYAILCDMIAHWQKKGYHEASGASLALKKDLEMRLGL